MISVIRVRRHQARAQKGADMSNTATSKRREAIAAALLVAAGTLAVAAAANAANLAPTDRQLANALVAAKADGLPRSWTRPEFNDDARGKCVSRSHRAITARARAGFGDPNAGMWSVATVLKTRLEATRYYRALRLALPGCLRRAVRDNPLDADSVTAARRLSFRRYGDRSAAWRIRATYVGNRFHYDWVVVQKGRAVLVDLFVLGADQRSAVPMEEEIVRRALRRAAASG